MCLSFSFSVVCYLSCGSAMTIVIEVRVRLHYYYFLIHVSIFFCFTKSYECASTLNIVFFCFITKSYTYLLPLILLATFSLFLLTVFLFILMYLLIWHFNLDCFVCGSCTFMLFFFPFIYKHLIHVDAFFLHYSCSVVFFYLFILQ